MWLLKVRCESKIIPRSRHYGDCKILVPRKSIDSFLTPDVSCGTPNMLNMKECLLWYNKKCISMSNRSYKTFHFPWMSFGSGIMTTLLHRTSLLCVFYFLRGTRQSSTFLVQHFQNESTIFGTNSTLCLGSSFL